LDGNRDGRDEDLQMLYTPLESFPAKG
jgi:hypothetical protein